MGERVGHTHASQSEWSLLERAGFRLVRIVPLMDGAGFTLFEAVLSD